VIYQSILITTKGFDSAAAAATSNGAYFQKQFDNPNDYVPLVIFQRYRIEKSQVEHNHLDCLNWCSPLLGGF
jgi:hypothetical protein